MGGGEPRQGYYGECSSEPDGRGQLRTSSWDCLATSLRLHSGKNLRIHQGLLVLQLPPSDVDTLSWTFKLCWKVTSSQQRHARDNKHWTLLESLAWKNAIWRNKHGFRNSFHHSTTCCQHGSHRERQPRCMTLLSFLSFRCRKLRARGGNWAFFFFSRNWPLCLWRGEKTGTELNRRARTSLRHSQALIWKESVA